MKRKSNWVLFILLCVIAAHFILPQRAVKGEFHIQWVSENGIDLTERLDGAEVTAMEELMESALCTRWRNPLGGYPVRKGTIVVAGTDDDGLCVATLVGSTGQYVVDDYNFQNGEALWTEIMALVEKEGTV